MTDDKRDPAVEALREKLRVSLTVKPEPSKLVVETAVSNATGEVVHVFNVLWDYAPSGAIGEPDSPAYVCVENGVLRLARRRLPYPAGRKVLVGIDPFLTPIAAGSVLREQMSFPVPLQEYSCYSRRQDDSPVEPVESTAAIFAYGIVVGAAEGAFGPAPASGALRLVNATRTRGILTIESGAVPCKVQVLRRQDGFPRF